MALLTLLDRINDLKRLPRTGWLLAGITPAESVADHSFATALLALILAEAINADLPAAQLDVPLNLALVMRIALLHDLAESMLTDLPHRATDLVSPAVKRDAEHAAMSAITRDLPAGSVWVSDWQAYAAGSSPEARLVRDADKLELAHQALRYAQSGRRDLDEFLTARTYNYPQSEVLGYEINQAFTRLGER